MANAKPDQPTAATTPAPSNTAGKKKKVSKKSKPKTISKKVRAPSESQESTTRSKIRKSTGELEIVPRERVVSIDPLSLHMGRYQARFKPTPDQELIDDILRASGNRTPVLVRESKLGFEVIGGENRVKAILQINEGRKIEDRIDVKCVVLDESDKEAALTALRDNLLRKDLTNKERDRYIYRLVNEWHYSPKEISKDLGLSEDTIRLIMDAFDKTHENVKSLLDKGDITVEHARTVISLDDEDQKKIARWLKTRAEKSKKAPFPEMPSTRDVRDKAKDYRTRREVRVKMLEHFTKMKEKTIELKRGDQWSYVTDVCKEVLGGRYYQGYNVQDHDVFTPMKEAGIELVFKKTTVGDSNDSYQEMLATGESATTEKPKPTGPPVICYSCIGHHIASESVQGHSAKCIHPEVEDNPQRTECELYVEGHGDRSAVQRCYFCNGLTQSIASEVSYIEVGPDVWELGFTIDELDATYSSHTQCAIDHLIKEKRLSGKCASCQNNECGLLIFLSQYPGLKVKVQECDFELFQERSKKKLEDINAWELQEYLAKVAEQAGRAA